LADNSWNGQKAADPVLCWLEWAKVEGNGLLEMDKIKIIYLTGRKDQMEEINWNFFISKIDFF
jgi:hypothetical protein